ncbi:hypothetical protein [Burkholderia alba]|uniref:hypothetical protein n=1 Tax=Burkholderia alba TaxID=2683677 RepID=UPI002B057C6B|nr:hypothetical protein [Burkholderia alba]
MQSYDRLPHTITAGVDFGWRTTLPAHPTPRWTLKLLLRGPSAIDLASTAAGAQHVFAVPATQTAAWAAGEYVFSLRAIDSGGAVVEIVGGQIEIERDLSAIETPIDTRGHLQKVLDAIEAVIERRASKDQERYRIQDRELYRTPIADLILLRNQYRKELRAMLAAQNGGNSLFGRTVRTWL